MSGPDELLADIDGFLKRYPHSPSRRVLVACRTHIADNAALAARCELLQEQVNNLQSAVEYWRAGREASPEA